jgi:hypothetical protein
MHDRQAHNHPKPCQLTRLIDNNNVWVCCSDLAVPDDPRGGCARGCGKYLADPQLGLWFGQNLVASHAKLIHIPIGLNNYRWPMGDVQVLTNTALSAPAWESRTTRLYLNVDVGTNAGRADVLAQLAQVPGAHRVSKRVDWQVYLTQLANSRYVAAPPGNGIDTHRAWEVCVNINNPTDFCCCPWVM